MKRNFLPLVLVASFILTSCMKDKMTKTFTVFEPVYRDKSAVLADIKSDAPRSIRNPGKIYQFGNYIFLNEINKGVHVINNSNPANPVNKAFINIPGNVDIAVKGNVLYADLFTDMVVISIADPLRAELRGVVPRIFPERQYGTPVKLDSGKLIVDWIEKRVTVRVTDIENRRPPCRNCVFDLLSGNGGVAGFGGSPATGKGGSMARFAIVKDHLYAVNINNLEVVSILDPLAPVHTGTHGIGWNIETIYPFKEKLFIGSATGMFIYSIANPALPAREGQFMHARACDPVVADDDFAFVTLRAGTFCQGVSNQLDVINVQNISSPRLVKTYPMTNPYGLAKDGELLFLCDGKDGLRIYNAANVLDLQLIKHIKDLETYDVIASNKILLLVARSGLYQYDYSDRNNINLISTMPVNP